MRRLAVLTTHPIQYNAPVFKLLTTRGNILLKVFYSWGEASSKSKYDPGFGRTILWDIPLEEGYEYEFLENISSDPGSSHFNGIDNPYMIATIEKWKPDCILIFGWSFKSHLKALRYFKHKIPVFFRGDSTLLDEPIGFSIKKIVRRLWLTWVYWHVDIVLFTGQANRHYFEKHGLSKDQLIYCPHAIDNDRFEEPKALYETEAALLRKNFNIPPEDVVFLFAGKLERKKNVQLLLEAFSSLQLNNSHLFVVGNGVLENVLKAKFSDHKNIHFLDFQNQKTMPVIYRIGDVFVLPSQGPGETWGLAANEAMASGCVVVMSDKCGGAPDLIIEHKNGYVFKSGDAVALAEKIVRLTKEKSLLAMKNRSREHIRSFSLEAICNAIEMAVNVQKAN